MQKVTLSILVLYAFSVVSAQTVVILKKYKDSIFVGADSRSIVYTVDGTKIKEVPSDMSCKIMTEGKFHIAFVGMPHEIAVSEAKLACKDASTFADAIKIFGKYFSDKLRILLDSIKQVNNPYYNQLKIEYKDYINQTIWFGFQADTTFALQLVFGFVNGSDEIGVGWQKETVLAGGHITELGSALYSDDTWKGGAINVLNHIISLQSSRHKKEVGGPIDILMITRQGKKWIQRKQNCEE